MVNRLAILLPIAIPIYFTAVLHEFILISERWESTYSKWKIPFERGSIFPGKHPLYVNGQHHIQDSIHQQHDNNMEHGKVIVHRRPLV